jgi:hypothetical protein
MKSMNYFSASMVCIKLPEDLYANCGAVDAIKSQVVQDHLFYQYKIEVSDYGIRLVCSQTLKWHCSLDALCKKNC